MLSQRVVDWARSELRFQPRGQFVHQSFPTAAQLETVTRGGKTARLWKWMIEHVKHPEKVAMIRANLRLHVNVDDLENAPARGKGSDAVSARLGEIERKREQLLARREELRARVHAAQDKQRQVLGEVGCLQQEVAGSQQARNEKEEREDQVVRRAVILESLSAVHDATADDLEACAADMRDRLHLPPAKDTSRKDVNAVSQLIRMCYETGQGSEDDLDSERVCSAKLPANHLLGSLAELAREEADQMLVLADDVDEGGELVPPNPGELIQARREAHIARCMETERMLTESNRLAHEVLEVLTDENMHVTIVGMRAVLEQLRQSIAGYRADVEAKVKEQRNAQTKFDRIRANEQEIAQNEERIQRLISDNAQVLQLLPNLQREALELVEGKAGKYVQDVMKVCRELAKFVQRLVEGSARVAVVPLASAAAGQEHADFAVPTSRTALGQFRAPPRQLQHVLHNLERPNYQTPETLSERLVGAWEERAGGELASMLLSERWNEIAMQDSELADVERLVSTAAAQDNERVEVWNPQLEVAERDADKGEATARKIRTRTLPEWWEQPGQFALPDVRVGGLNMQETLERWRSLRVQLRERSV